MWFTAAPWPGVSLRTEICRAFDPFRAATARTMDSLVGPIWNVRDTVSTPQSDCWAGISRTLAPPTL